MFNKFTTISYTINDKDLSVKDFSKSFDLSSLKDNIYSKNIETDTFLDVVSYNTYDSFVYYHVPLYVGDILNPYKELPKTSKESELNLEQYTSLFFTNIAGSCFSVGDLIAKSHTGYSAGFDVTDNFGYVVDIDLELKKLKLLNIGSVGTGPCLLLRKNNNSWGIFATFYNNLEENYANSAKEFFDNSSIQSIDTNILNTYYDFRNGQTSMNYSFNTENDIFKGNKSILYLLDRKSLTNFEDALNVGS